MRRELISLQKFKDLDTAEKLILFDIIEEAIRLYLDGCQRESLKGNGFTNTH